MIMVKSRDLNGWIRVLKILVASLMAGHMTNYRGINENKQERKTNAGIRSKQSNTAEACGNWSDPAEGQQD